MTFYSIKNDSQSLAVGCNAKIRLGFSYYKLTDYQKKELKRAVKDCLSVHKGFAGIKTNPQSVVVYFNNNNKNDVQMIRRMSAVIGAEIEAKWIETDDIGHKRVINRAVPLNITADSLS